MQAIILAGGFGTRLKEVIKDVPKPMAEVSGKPFLAWIIENLGRQGVNEICLSVHHLPDSIKNYFGNNYKGIDIKYAYEDEPLGTGGALKNALNTLKPSKPVIAMNGDTVVNISYQDLYKYHQKNFPPSPYPPEGTRRVRSLRGHFITPSPFRGEGWGGGAELTIVLKRMSNCSRYGFVSIDEENFITGFNAGGKDGSGLINAGTYIISPALFENMPDKFSFEADFMGQDKVKSLAYITDEYFIDIGIPEDYEKAQKELEKKLV